MKLIKIIITTAIFIFAINALSVQAGSPPPPPPGHSTTGNVPGGGAPIGSGVVILLVLGAAYGGKKVYDFRKKRGENSMTFPSPSDVGKS